MKFCDKCETYMVKTKRGFSCPKCGNLILPRIIEVKKMEHSYTDRVYIANNSVKDHANKVNQICPLCGNYQAFHWISEISGEHAGVKQERTIEHYKCTKCFHSWRKNL